MPIAYSQASRHLLIGTPLGDDVLLPVSATLTERIGGLFTCELELASEDPEIDPLALLGQNVTVRAVGVWGDGEDRLINGHVARFVQTHVAGGSIDGRSEEEFSRYSATLVPWPWMLSRGADCRIFQQMSVPDIVKQVCNELSIGQIDDRLTGSYPTLEYCVQYRETGLNFIMRLLEQEGIGLFFTHDDGQHKLVLADAKSSFYPLPGHAAVLVFRPREGNDAESAGGYIRTLAAQGSVEPHDFSLTDYDPLLPRKNLMANAIGTPDPAEHGRSVFDYPGEYVETSRGESLVKIRMEESLARAGTFRGTGDTGAMAAGHLLSLTEHPREAFNQQYLLTGVTTRITSDLSPGGPKADCQFTAIQSDVAFRPPRLTPRPIVRGPQTAFVVGPGGEEIYVDEHGRIKVQFHWDRYGEANEHSSCWVRVAKPIAGRGWGHTAWPRIGQEVIVEFLEGDPDRPLVTGSVYNGVNQPPYALPANKTISTFKSNSSKGGGGFNEFRFEDKAGEEQVFLHAQKNMDTRVLNDQFEHVGNNKHLIVKQDQREKIGVDLHQTIKRDHQEKVGRDRHTIVVGKQAESIGAEMSLKVTSDLVEEIGSNHTEDVTKTWYLKAGMNAIIESTAGITLKCGGNSIVIDPSGVTVKGTMVVLDGSMTRINSGPGSPPTAGQAGDLVSPVPPEKPDDADEADPGEVEEAKAVQRQTKSGKYGSTQVPPFVPPDADEQPTDDEETDFIEIELKDDDGEPVPGEAYEIELPDGSIASGTLDSKGYARVDGIKPGDCKVRFPGYDTSAWDPE